MAFLIPDNLKSRKDVPEPIRTLAKALEIALDSTATLWFEPLFDPTGDRPHFVLLLPDRGIVVLELLEIAKAGGLLGLVKGKIRVLRDGKEVDVANPLQRAAKFAEILRARIAAEPRLAKLGVAVGAGAVLHLVSRKEAESKGLGTALAPTRCIYREDIELALQGNGEQQLMKTFVGLLGGTWLGEQPPETEKLLRGIVQPGTVIDRHPKDGSKGLVIFRPPAGNGDIVRVMDRKQESMAKSLGEGHRIIRGVAGSGKTLILVYRAKLLAEWHPDRSVLVTCFTRSLAGQLKEYLSDRPMVMVKNLDAIMKEFIDLAGIPFPGFKVGKADDLVGQAALKALTKVPKPRYSAVLLDEAQDFGEEAIRFALGLLESPDSDLVIVADSAQNIFNKTVSWKKLGVNAAGRTRILNINYRNTKEILAFAYGFLLRGKDITPDSSPETDDQIGVIPPEAALRSGPVPTVDLGHSPKGEVDAAIACLRKWLKAGASRREIAVIYYRHKDDVQTSALIREMKSAGLPFFWMTDPASPAMKDKLGDCTEPIVVTTVHSAKGLEFNRVLLFGWPWPNDAATTGRRLTYVAMTRATEELHVVAGNGHPYADDYSAVRASLSAGARVPES